MTDHRHNFHRLRWIPLLAGAAGVGASVWLLKSFGLRRIGDLIGHAGWWGILAVVAFHGVQMLCSALGWRAIAGSPPPRETRGTYVVLRWIREGVNNLLPLAQVGGEVVAWRLLCQRGARLPNAIAGTVADLSLELLTQILFTLVGVILLLVRVADSRIAAGVAAGLLLVSIAMAAVLAAVRLGLAQAIENELLRIGRWIGWAGAAHVEGLNLALTSCYRHPGRVARSALWHMCSWLLGGVEVCIALHLLGVDVGIGTGLVIESLGQAAKALGFAVPGALGVQEGGYIAVCAACGIPAEVAISLSLLKRLREVVLGIPALIAWQNCEARLRTPPHDSISRSML